MELAGRILVRGKNEKTNAPKVIIEKTNAGVIRLGFFLVVDFVVFF